ncbi:hypothetical protein PCANC_23330 [Puccinia coronata f. sp. avenae]|uniref:Secreted protein n=1 Tax=Puccinia coronata f. sp. avenae TaxID=200324 RepID=A0A2N5S415_9BASI|nr:hypothetical protein PCANC_23330 [Puccinia coronata f. sp. avenae]
MLSLAVSLTALTLVAQTFAHLSLVSVHGSNGAVGHGFGVNLYGKYPREKGIPGDAGGDSGIFQTGTDDPSPPCGGTPELGPIDVVSWLDQAEGSGLPSAYANLSVVAEVFQVNRDGGGPMSCEYSEDATAATWKPMFMSLNQAGNSGIQNQVRTNETVVMNFPEGAKCTGGWTQAACIVRCRTGVNKRFGGCFAVKLADAVQYSAVAAVSVKQVDTAETTLKLGDDTAWKLTEEQIILIANQVIIEMKKEGLVVSASTSTSSTSPLNVTTLSNISDKIQLSSNDSAVLNPVYLPVKHSSNYSNVYSNSSSVDASDAADKHLYEIANATGSAIVAANIVDHQLNDLSSPIVASSSPVDVASPPVDVASPPVDVASPPVVAKSKKNHKTRKQSSKCKAPRSKHDD